MDKYVFLDFNGTVLDDLDLCLNLLNEMLIMKGCKSVSLEEYKEIFGFPIINYYVKAGFDFSKYSFSELADYFIIEYGKRNYHETSIFDDVKDFIIAVREKGYKIVLCSASQLTLLKEQLIYFNISDLFDDVIGLNDHHANSKLFLAKEYVKNHPVDLENSYFIGDTTHDVEVGIECGLKPLLINRGHQSNNVLSKTNVVILPNFNEVIKLL